LPRITPAGPNKVYGKYQSITPYSQLYPLSSPAERPPCCSASHMPARKMCANNIRWTGFPVCFQDDHTSAPKYTENFRPTIPCLYEKGMLIFSELFCATWF